MISRRLGRTELQLAMTGTGFIGSLWKNRQHPQGLKPALSLLLDGAAKAAPLQKIICATATEAASPRRNIYATATEAASPQRNIYAIATEARAVRKLPYSSRGNLNGPPNATTSRQSNCGTGRGAPELTLEAR
jgi:hypothetical protein